MPLLRQIVQGRSEPEIDNARIKQLIKWISIDAIPFDIQVAYDIATEKVEHDDNIIKMDETIGCVKPPYPIMWMEWFSRTIHNDATTERNYGCLVTTEDLAKPPGYKDCDFCMYLFIKDPKTGLLASMEIIWLYNIDKMGYISLARFGPLSGEALSEQETDYVTHVANHCLTALALINCKNVKTESKGAITLARSGTEKRRGIPARKVKYHTIILPGGGTESDGRGGHRATAIHRVRGHFKTFTAERPLLGQHVGTYWWGWQVRGNAEKGIVVSDYKLKESV